MAEESHKRWFSKEIGLLCPCGDSDPVAQQTLQLDRVPLKRPPSKCLGRAAKQPHIIPKAYRLAASVPNILTMLGCAFAAHHQAAAQGKER